MSAARTLFAMHYRRLVVPLVVLAASFYLLAVTAIAVSARAGHAMTNDPTTGVDILLLFVLFIFALPAGTAPFSRALKEQQILFFHALPLPRAMQWLALTGSSLAALATTVALVGIVRPGVAAILLQRPTFVLILGMLLTFAAGAAFSLVFVQPLAVYVSAYAMTAAAVVMATYTSIAPLTSVSSLAELRAGGIVLSRANVSNAVATSLALLLTVLLFALSMFFYRRGELVILRTQVRNLAVAAGAIVAFAVFVTPLTVAALTAGGPMTLFDISASPDGRTVVGVYRSARAFWRWEQRIVDTATGAVTSRQSGPLSQTARWTPRGELVLVERSVSRIPFRRRVTRVALLTGDGRVNAAVDFPGEDVLSVDAASEPLTIVTTDGVNGRIVQWDRRSVRELVRTPFVYGEVNGAVAYVSDASGASLRGWRIAGGTASPLPFAGSVEDRNPFVINGVLYGSAGAAISRISAAAPLPRAGQASWLLRSNSFHLRRLYVAIDDALYLLDGTSWRLVTTGLPAWRGVSAYRERYDVAVSADGVAAFVAESMLRVYDPASGRTIDAGPVAGRGTVVWRSPTLLRYVVARTAGDYRYANGSVVPIPHGFGAPIAVRADGSQVRAQASTLVITAPDGRVVRRIAL